MIGKSFSVDGENVLVSGLYTDSQSALAREAAYRLYLYPDSHQEQLLSDLLRCRYELARTCGFETYAHRALKSSTAETPGNVIAFLDELSEGLRSRADKDFEIMYQHKVSYRNYLEKICLQYSILKVKDSGKNLPLAAWDTPYFTAKIKKQWLQTSPSEFTPYFSLGGCMEGLNNLMQALYGITLQNTELEPGELEIYKKICCQLKYHLYLIDNPISR